MSFFLILLGGLFCGLIALNGTPSVVFSFQNYFYSGLFWPGGFFVDNCSLFINIMLFICFSLVAAYTPHYFGGGAAATNLSRIICLFVGVMALLVYTGDILSTLVLWEYLGVVSFFLILFYASFLSLRASVITLVSSRFGDVAIFLLLVVGVYVTNNSMVAGVCAILIICTKSASFPFISWLLEAMRAPTPVSSLVHSSTLVAAGVWFALRYDLGSLMIEDSVTTSILISTVIITGTSSFFFTDLKKIVALSTCNNINWCVIYLTIGGVWLSLVQLICHGVSKCVLFMLVGDVMSGVSGSQASNFSYSPVNYGRMGSFGLVCLILGLSGAPFIGVFFSKHLMLSSVFGLHSVVATYSVFIGVMLSYLYSYRLCIMLISSRTSSSVGVLFTCAAGSVTYWWLFMNFFLCSALDEFQELQGLPTAAILLFQVVSGVICWWFYDSVILSSWCSSLFGVDGTVESCYSWFTALLCISRVCLFRWDSYCLAVFKFDTYAAKWVFSSANIVLVTLACFLVLLCLIV
uniref:NADH:ubiquinone reductase (H(+)-translocating) n=1 Tax=Parabreviscolex niepini TaxID=2041585 RepID=A0A3G2QVN1_9CEST|nr:NADH dehydrogenase subunit 5 [Parabreviscolex niepini]AYO27345.1 NADH dehydrogenase subunit 5 [Parabreviscolex niepini]